MTRQDFYATKAWKQVRLNVWRKQNCLCARCHKPVYVDKLSDYIPKDRRVKGIVHHKIYLDDENFTNLNISLNMDNLEGLCIDCHNKEHFESLVTRDDVMFDDDGNLISRR